MINVVRGFELSRANGALHCNVWVGFILRPKAKLRLKVDHVVSDMTERKSIVLLRVIVLYLLPRQIRGWPGSIGRYSVLANNVSQNGVCIGDTCREVRVLGMQSQRLHTGQKNGLSKQQVESDPQSRSPEHKNRISSDRTEETVVKNSKRKKRLPLRPNGTPASQRYSATPRNA